MVAKIDTETSRIIFSTKGFIAVIAFIFTVFFGFYGLVITPKFTSYDTKIEKIIDNQSIVNKEMYKSINALNTSIAVLNENLKNIEKNEKHN